MDQNLNNAGNKKYSGLAIAGFVVSSNGIEVDVSKVKDI